MANDNFIDIIYFIRQAATKKQLEMLRTDDVSLESMLEGNDSIFANLQENLKIEDGKKKPTSGKVAPSARISKPGTTKFFLVF